MYRLVVHDARPLHAPPRRWPDVPHACRKVPTPVHDDAPPLVRHDRPEIIHRGLCEPLGTARALLLQHAIPDSKV